MLRLVFRIPKTTPRSGKLVYNFSTDFGREFGLGPAKASLIKKSYRRFLKSSNRLYLIPFKLAAGGLFLTMLLIILPGVSYPFQKRLKSGVISIIDQFLYMGVKHHPSLEKTSKYLNSLISILYFWDSNGVSNVEQTNETIKKIRDVVENYPMADESFANLFCFLELRIKKLVETNKKTLIDPQFYSEILKIFQSYLKFRDNNESTKIDKMLFSKRIESLMFVIDYLSAYSEGSNEMIGNLARIAEHEPDLGAQIIKNKSVLQLVINHLNGENRPEALHLLETISKSPRGRIEMEKINLVANLIKYLPEKQIKPILSHFT